MDYGIVEGSEKNPEKRDIMKQIYFDKTGEELIHSLSGVVSKEIIPLGEKTALEIKIMEEEIQRDEFNVEEWEE